MKSTIEAQPGADLFTPVKPIPSNYIPGLDGMRALAVALVVCGHSGISFVPAAIGVTIFFFLSGFLITNLLVSEQQVSGSIDVKSFYIRRYLRLMPEQLFYVMAGLILGMITGVLPAAINTIAALFYFTNYIKIFGIGHEANPMVTGHFWSLAVEEHFYLVWPVVFWSVGGKLKRLIGVIAVVLIICLVWRITTIHIGLPHEYVEFASDTRIDSIGYGCLCALLLRCYPAISKRIKAAGHLPLIAGTIILLILVVWRIIGSDNGVFSIAVRYSVQGVGFMIYFTYIVGGAASVLLKLLEQRLIRYLGRVSYGLYLWHFAAIYSFVAFAGYTAPSDMPLGLRLACAVSAFVVAAFIGDLSAKYVLAPFNPLRRRFGSHVAADGRFAATQEPTHQLRA